MYEPTTLQLLSIAVKIKNLVGTSFKIRLNRPNIALIYFSIPFSNIRH